MDTIKRKQAILYIEANRLFFYPGITGEILQLAFPEDIISNLEVLNSQKFTESLASFIQGQKIPPSDILVIFSPAIVFEKEFPLDEKKESIQFFLDYVPFDEVLSKSFPMNKKLHIFAINAQLYTLLKQVFEKYNCNFNGVIAYGSLLESAPELAQKVNLQLLLARVDSFKQFSLDQSQQEEKTVEGNKEVTKNSNKRTYILLGVFGVLIAILIGMIVLTNSNTPSVHVVNTPRSLPTIIVSPTVPIPSLVTPTISQITQPAPTKSL